MLGKMVKQFICPQKVQVYKENIRTYTFRTLKMDKYDILYPFNYWHKLILNAAFNYLVEGLIFQFWMLDYLL